MNLFTHRHCLSNQVPKSGTRSLRLLGFALLALMAPTLAPPGIVAREEPAAALEPTMNEGITLNFDRVDIRTFIAAISKFTGCNMAVTPEVHGEISIYSPVTLDRDTTYDVFLSVLDLHGLTAVQSGEVIKVVPRDQAVREGVPVIVGRTIPSALPGDSVATLILPVDLDLDPGTLRQTAQGILSKQGAISHQEGTASVVVSDKVSNLRKLVLVLDAIRSTEPEITLKTYTLKYAPATDAATRIQQFLAGVSQAGRRRASVIDDPRTNSVMVSGSSTDHLLVEQLVQSLDRPQPEERTGVVVVFLEHADAAALAQVLNAQGQSAGQESAGVVADIASNALVLNGPPQAIAQLQEIIRQLDITRSQVFVEAVIMEITMKRLRELGVEWRAMDQPSEDSVRGFGGTNFRSGGEEGALNRMAANPFDSPSGMSFGVVKGIITIGGQEFLNLGAMLHALQDDSAVNILSTPRITTLDNKEAEIVVGEERPYLKSSQTTDSDQLLRTYEFKDIGLTLRLTPHISLGHLVRLELFQEIKSFVQESDIGAVTTTKRQARTTVVVENSDTVVIGGLIKDDSIDTTSKVPCLGTLPLLGPFFRNKSRDVDKTNLLIFLTPHILNTPEEVRELSERIISEASQRPAAPGVLERMRDEAAFAVSDQPADGDHETDR
ncbi:hypothetical protein JW905_03635 [bacterium]|nr:hypothetical protein [candidate division CSSED10-310 bacterium]